MTGLDIKCNIFLLGLFVMVYFIRNYDSYVLVYVHVHALNMYYISYRYMYYVYIC